MPRPGPDRPRPATSVGDQPTDAHAANTNGDPPADGPLPAKVGPYRVRGLLGRGGMGAVYRAEEPALKRQVAVKVMLPAVAADPKARARFVREAQAQARVEHDHIIPIYRVGEDNGVPFIAMPLLKGGTLADHLAASPHPPLAEVVRIAREMAEGLAAAHAAGLVHRDVKPGNVWLEGDRRRVKLLDFGLARPAAAGPGAEVVTGTGAVVGTPAYMAPEQARGRPVDRRADLFALGVVLYELLTGRRPFRGADPFALMQAVVAADPPPPAAVRPGVPAALSDLAMRLLAKDPADRPADAGAVVVELRAAEARLSGTPTTDLPAADPFAELAAPTVGVSSTVRAVPVRRRAWAWPAVGLAVLTVAGLLAAVVVRVNTPKGTRVAGGDDPAAAVRVRAEKPSAAPPAAASPPTGRTVQDAGVTAAEPLPAAPEPAAPLDPPPTPAPPAPTQPTVEAVTPPPEVAPVKPANTRTDRPAIDALRTHWDVTVRTDAGDVVTVPRGEPLPAGKLVLLGLYDGSRGESPFPPGYAAAVLIPNARKCPDLTTLDALNSHNWLTEVEALSLFGGQARRLGNVGGVYLPMTAGVIEGVRRYKGTIDPPVLTTLAITTAAADDVLIARLATLKGIEGIWLRGVGTGPRLSGKGLEAVGRMPLTFLALNNSKGLTAADLRKAAAGPKLRWLNLSWAELDDAALAGLADTAATDLALYGSAVTDAAVPHLLKLTGLTKLNVSDTKLTTGGAQLLADGLPGCEVYWGGKRVKPGG